MTDRGQDDSRVPDWEPRGSAVGVPDGERRAGSTGQTFEARDGRWVRVRDPVRVGCTQPGGLMIRYVVQEPADPFKQPRVSAGVRLNGPSTHVAAGVGVPIAPGGDFGTTEVAAEFWRLWHDQNTGRNPLLDGGTIFLLDDDGKPPENPT